MTTYLHRVEWYLILCSLSIIIFKQSLDGNKRDGKIPVFLKLDKLLLKKVLSICNNESHSGTLPMTHSLLNTLRSSVNIISKAAHLSPLLIWLKSRFFWQLKIAKSIDNSSVFAQSPLGSKHCSFTPWPFLVPFFSSATQTPFPPSFVHSLSTEIPIYIKN